MGDSAEMVETAVEENVTIAPVDRVRVFLVDDHQVILDGVDAMLQRYADRIVIVGTAHRVDEALERIPTSGANVVLTDLRLRGDSGVALCGELASRLPDLAVVFFTVNEDEQYLHQALQVGARGYLLKQTSGEDLVRHLEEVVAGEIVIDPTMMERVSALSGRLASGEFWPGAHLGLSQRESEVLGLVVRGLANRAIAQELIVGEETVKSHISSIYRKLDVRDRSQAVAVALREGVFE